MTKVATFRGAGASDHILKVAESAMVKVAATTRFPIASTDLLNASTIASSTGHGRGLESALRTRVDGGTSPIFHIHQNLPASLIRLVGGGGVYHPIMDAVKPHVESRPSTGRSGLRPGVSPGSSRDDNSPGPAQEVGIASSNTISRVLPVDGEALTENRAASAALTALPTLAQENHTCR